MFICFAGAAMEYINWLGGVRSGVCHKYAARLEYIESMFKVSLEFIKSFAIYVRGCAAAVNGVHQLGYWQTAINNYSFSLNRREFFISFNSSFNQFCSASSHCTRTYASNSFIPIPSRSVK